MRLLHILSGIALVIAVIAVVQSCRTAGPLWGDVSSVRFGEIWGYLMKGEESSVKGDEPLTDIGYFCASVSPRGRMSGTCRRPVISWEHGEYPRTHMVVAVLNNPPLMHQCLDPSSPVRDLLVKDIVTAGRPFDGVQIDFESVPSADAAAFIEFLREIKANLRPGAVLSVAVPARRKKVSDAYDYEAIAAVADRVVVMAYDQHWRTSPPGPVASLPWCREVVQYAKSAIPVDKLIMGLPLYARAWHETGDHRSLRYKQVREILKKSGARPQYEHDKGLFFEYQETVTVKVFFDDHRTILEKLHMYRSEGVTAVSFWRIGQGPDTLWRYIRPGNTPL